MFEIKEKKINRKQFHYLLCKFLLEKRVIKRFYDSSIKYKLRNMELGRAYSNIYREYNFSKEDTVSEHLYKCIDVYCNGKDFRHTPYIDVYYHGSIRGFFSLLPSTFDEDYYFFWKKISDEWSNMTYDVQYDYRLN